MKKYSLKTILDYVNGNDITNYDIDYLENDVQFMKEVINLTNDKNMYNLCSDKVKYDYEFVIFMIYKFENDLLFLNEIIEKFMKQTENIFEKIEVQLALCEIVKNKDYEMYQDNYFIVEALYGIIKQEVEIEKSKEPLLQEGFNLIRYSFDFSELALNYFAKNFVEEIFSRYIKLEEYLHDRYDTYQQFKETGVVNFIINVLNCYDNCLSDYVATHPQILDDLLKKFQRIEKNWNWYIRNVNEKKYSMIFDVIYDKIEESKSWHLITGLELLIHFADKFNFVDEVLKYKLITVSEYEEIIKNSQINIKNMDFNFLKIYYEIQKEVLKILKQKNPQEVDNYIEDVKPQVDTNMIIDFKTKQIKKINAYH